MTLARTMTVGAAVGLAVALVLAPMLRGDLISVPMPPWAGALMGAGSAALWWQWASRSLRSV